MKIRAIGAGFCALALVLSGCGSSKDSTTSDSKAKSTTTQSHSDEGDSVDLGVSHEIGSYAVGRIDQSFVDDSRVTPAHGGQPEVESRTLNTMILYPAAGTAPADPSEVTQDAAPLKGSGSPLIVFGHGSTRAGVDYIKTLAAWASAGYVVAAPNFPLSQTDTPGGTNYGDLNEQPSDVSFLIDSIDALATDKDSPLNGLVDIGHIGIGGQSFGAITAVATGFNACCADDRIDAVTVFAGIWMDLGSGNETARSGDDLPALFVHGDDDEVLPYEGGRAAADLLKGPTTFATIVGGSHDDGYFGGLDDPTDEVVTRLTTAFYNSTLRGAADLDATLAKIVADSGVDIKLD
ncbi:MAG: alpha/beta hydrolase [Acidimicrobiales bacterium]|nr:alpha/beta hydrolase [Acidimicrobiales bacterium]